ncbi:xanthine dehydrogenase family protein molybdopterin-binding subunit [Bradyrhizobium neotropicale]|uniref:xanthine dehydrogenase family protein molybdopterin-binding subunit n=1 Tax=Bradyrhizobium neotropicale TaxID=1497615 RepID=UPI001AD6A7FB|nr:xanthine dehydrogenase family protein molybdopterin-binding subunit [Bradyrhizobium neotropicale]MBO4226822.1 molybdopterin-dependent oxidoreductase [Bradyrhizobium neotropicale]
MKLRNGKAGPLSLTRRKLVLGGSLVGGALIIGYTAMNFGSVAAGALSIGAEQPAASPFGPFIRIDADGWVTVVNAFQEMGQGVHAGIAAIIAEELDADWGKIRVVAAPANTAVYKNGAMGMQVTAGSSAIAGAWHRLRTAGAAAREMFVQAAAQKWDVQAGTITVRNGMVIDTASKLQESFGSLLTLAAKQQAPSAPLLKSPDKFELVGSRRIGRKDGVSKVTGGPIYTQDVQLPGMLVAMVAHPPRFGAKMRDFDAAAARSIKGVVDVFAVPSGVAVVAQDTWSARKGRDALSVSWDEEAVEKRSSVELRQLFQQIGELKTNDSGRSYFSKGDPAKAFNEAEFQASYDFPYLAHAPMEPMNCVAQVDGRQVKLTVASQLQTIDQINTALAAITLPGSVQIETLPAGGSFGRRGLFSSDYIVECVRIARHVGGGKPVKLVWTREDDTISGFYRPMAHHRLWINRDADGLPTAWRHHTVAQSLLPIGPNSTEVEGIETSSYVTGCSVADCRVFTPTVGVPVGFWRSVGNSHTAMVLEHTIDQLAHMGGIDPAEYRRAIYRKAGDERRLAALELVCERAGWGQSMQDGWARGLAVHEAFGTVVAQVAEVAILDGRPRIRRVVCAVDCGIAVVPDQIAAQMEGGICFGLSAALYGKITLGDGGTPAQNNFDTYEVLRHPDAPVVETHIVPSRRDPSGVGEPGVPPIAPAVANALLVLTGEPTTSLPFVS